MGDLARFKHFKKPRIEAHHVSDAFKPLKYCTLSPHLDSRDVTNITWRG